jgi:hypothetical protein
MSPLPFAYEGVEVLDALISAQQGLRPELLETPKIRAEVDNSDLPLKGFQQRVELSADSNAAPKLGTPLQ